ncbi:DNA repair protein RecN [Aestuariibius sp. HNIBRBA575]|uniref:DNA repair protein RecN n=1 Tax=Aestuariibius sp. HNIBRBA575 TaxID=3233343 RepID=UPI0034A152C6
MLRALDIRDMLIIDRLELEFQPGLNVLTGETGAGKSILLDSLGFVLGWRGRAELVRNGAEKGEVIAEFDLPPGHAAWAVLQEAGIDTEDELILRRVNGRDGRKTAWVNDRRVSGDVLRALSATLVELHGQHDDRGLLNPRGHRALLDAYLDDPAAFDRVRKAWAKLRVARKELAKAQAKVEALKSEEEFLRHAVAELDQLGPMPGEEAELDVERRRMQGAEKVRGDIARAASILAIDGVEGQVRDAMRWLDSATEGVEGQLDAPLEALTRAIDALNEAEQGVHQCLNVLDFDPLALENCEERLFAIRGLARKYEVLPDDLATFTEGLRENLAALDSSVGDLDVLQAALDKAQNSYDTAAGALTAKRRKAGTALEKSMGAELAPLKMERAVFTVEITTEDAGPDGTDAVTFCVATNPGAPAGQLDKIASGGELSRFLLALKVCLTGEDSGLTLIFDEIDRGVGGATADAVGRRLEGLASKGQILVVTHSPQVAARGAHHWRVEKLQSAKETLSRVVPLDDVTRTDEIARMISGDRLTDEARAAAKALMSG